MLIDAAVDFPFPRPETAAPSDPKSGMAAANLPLPKPATAASEPQANSADMLRRATEPRPVISDARLLETLLPRQPVAPSTAPGATWGSAGHGTPPTPVRRRQEKVEEATEVHVSIGRIELTAIHEAPPPKRSVPRVGKPMTLEDYLDRRRGGRR